MSDEEPTVSTDARKVDPSSAARPPGGWATPALAFLSVAGLFVIGGFLIVYGVPGNLDATLLGVLLAAFIALAKDATSYYFGSSAGSERKTEMLNDKTTRVT